MKSLAKTVITILMSIGIVKMLFGLFGLVTKRYQYGSETSQGETEDSKEESEDK